MSDPIEEPLLRIGDAADRADLSVRTLRHWDQVGLVVPHGRTDGGYRLYTEDDIQRLLVVRYMKPLDLSIDEMRALLDDRDILHGAGPTTPATAEEREGARARLEPLLELAERRVKKLTDQLTEVCSFGARLRVELETGLPTLGTRLG